MIGLSHDFKIHLGSMHNQTKLLASTLFNLKGTMSVISSDPP